MPHVGPFSTRGFPYLISGPSLPCYHSWAIQLYHQIWTHRVSRKGGGGVDVLGLKSCGGYYLRSISRYHISLSNSSSISVVVWSVPRRVATRQSRHRWSLWTIVRDLCIMTPSGSVRVSASSRVGGLIRWQIPDSGLCKTLGNFWNQFFAAQV